MKGLVLIATDAVYPFTRKHVPNPDRRVTRVGQGSGIEIRESIETAASSFFMQEFVDGILHKL